MIKINRLNVEEAPEQYILEMTKEKDQTQLEQNEINQSEVSQLNGTLINDYASEQCNDDSEDYSKIQKKIYLEHAKNCQEALQQAKYYCQDQQDYETSVKIIQDFFKDVEEKKIAEPLNSEQLFELHENLGQYYKKCNKYVQSLQEFEKALKHIHSEATVIKTSKSSEEHHNIRKILCKFSNNI